MGFFKIAGTIAGGIGGFLLGGPAGAVAGAGIGASLGSSFEGATQAEKQGLELRKEATDISREQADLFTEEFAPLIRQLTEEAKLPVEEQPSFLRATGRLERGFSDLSANVRRSLAGRFPSGAGIERAAQETIEVGRIGARADLFSEFDEARRRNLANLASTGLGLGTTARIGLESGARAAEGRAEDISTSAGGTISNLLQLLIPNAAAGTKKKPKSVFAGPEPGSFFNFNRG